jgi:TonB family protein
MASFSSTRDKSARPWIGSSALACSLSLVGACLAWAPSALAQTIYADDLPAAQRPKIKGVVDPPTYPADALAKGEKGYVRAALCVSAEGAPEEVKLNKSSGSETLDKATLAWIAATLRFDPATKDGKPVRVCDHLVGFEWKPETAVAAAPPSPPPPPPLAAPKSPAARAIAFMDHDTDGKVSLNEYLNFQLPRIAQFDANKNGRLSREEFTSSLDPASQKNADRSFLAFDLNKDRALSQEEFLGYHAFVFKNYVDKNRDGFLTEDELAALSR